MPLDRTVLSEPTESAQAFSPLALDAQSTRNFLDHCHRQRYPARSDIFRPGDAANSLYYVVNGSLSVISEEPDGRELVLGYINAGQFIGEMGLFVHADIRHVVLRTRTPCELAEIGYARLHELFAGSLSEQCPRILHAIGAQLSKRLLDTSRKASRMAFLDVTDRIIRTLNDLCEEPDALSHPQGAQIHASRQELARIVGCSREMAGRVLKQLQIDGKLHARGKTIVVYRPN
jgi:CRP/FNR family cyclic AMP-dependent transcriptional regulator